MSSFVRSPLEEKKKKANTKLMMLARVERREAIYFLHISIVPAINNATAATGLAADKSAPPATQRQKPLNCFNFINPPFLGNSFFC